jgi:hypothetical protein
MTPPRLVATIVGGALLGLTGVAVIAGLTACRAFRRRARYRRHAGCPDRADSKISWV